MKKISFVVYYPYQWFIYRNIYRKIPADKREVIVDLSANPLIQGADVKESIVFLLTRENVTFRIFEVIDFFNASVVEKFFSNVEVIVSCWETGCVSHPSVAHIKKVNTTYGLGKELTMLRPSRSLHDVILAYGKRDQALFSLLSRSVAIGNPRLDNFYGGAVDGSMRARLLLHAKNKEKKLVLYAPTYGDLGSARLLLPEFKRLSERYNIVFKPHYFTLREDQATVEEYRSIGSLLVIDDTWDTILVAAAVDVVVSDNSSMIFDTMQVDKPLVVCDFLSRNFLDVVHKNLRFIKRGFIGALTYSDSFEQEIKNKRLVPTIKKPEELENILENIETVDKRFGDFRKEIVRNNFAYTDGSSSERAANIIMDIYNTKRAHKEGILHHAYLAYNNRIYRGLVPQNAAEPPSAAPTEKVVVWIFCEKKSSTEEILGTIYSCLNEKAVTHVCVSGADGEDMAPALAYGGYAERVTFFQDHGDGLRSVYSKLDKDGVLLFVKANTQIQKLDSALSFKRSCKRDAVFFAENVFFNPEEKNVKLFYLLKSEILGFRCLSSRNTLVSVSSERIEAIEKSALLIDGGTLLQHDSPAIDHASFDAVMSFFIMVDSLTHNEQHGILYNDFVLMPNFFVNCKETIGADILKKLVSRGRYLDDIGIPTSRWPDNHIGRYLAKIITGDYRYYQLLRLLFLKMWFVNMRALQDEN